MLDGSLTRCLEFVPHIPPKYGQNYSLLNWDLFTLWEVRRGDANSLPPTETTKQTEYRATLFQAMGSVGYSERNWDIWNTEETNVIEGGWDLASEAETLFPKHVIFHIDL